MLLELLLLFLMFVAVNVLMSALIDAVISSCSTLIIFKITVVVSVNIVPLVDAVIITSEINTVVTPIVVT